MRTLCLLLLAALSCLAQVVTAPAAAALPLLPTPGSWPVGGAIRQLREFDPPTVRWAPGHRGVDLAARVGQPVMAAAAGEVSFAGPVGGRGVVVVTHGALRTTYEPLSTVVSRGARVRRGQVIGVVTAGPHCREPCVHWGLLAGRTYLDPTTLVEPRPVRLVSATEAQAVARIVGQRTSLGWLAQTVALSAERIQANPQVDR